MRCFAGTKSNSIVLYFQEEFIILLIHTNQNGTCFGMFENIIELLLHNSVNG